MDIWVLSAWPCNCRRCALFVLVPSPSTSATLLACSAPPLKKGWAALYFCSCCFSSLLVFHNLPLSTERKDWVKELFFLLPLPLCIFAQQTTIWPILSVLVHRRFIVNVKPQAQVLQAFLRSAVSAVFSHDVSKPISSGEKLGYIQSSTFSTESMNKSPGCAKNFVIVTLSFKIGLLSAHYYHIY